VEAVLTGFTKIPCVYDSKRKNRESRLFCMRLSANIYTITPKSTNVHKIDE